MREFKSTLVVILVIWRISDTWDTESIASHRRVINVSIPSKEILRYFRITEIIFLVCVLWCLNNIIGLRIGFRDKLSPLPHCPKIIMTKLNIILKTYKFIRSFFVYWNPLKYSGLLNHLMLLLFLPANMLCLASFPSVSKVTKHK